MKIFKRIAFVLLILLTAASSFGCSGLIYNSHRNDYIYSQMNNYQFTADFQRAWTEARRLLFENGYVVRDSGNGYNVETEWGMIDDDTFRRYFVSGYMNPDGTSSIQFNYVEETRNVGMRPYTEHGRDFAMEYELLRRVDHNTWMQIDAEASAYAESKMND